jgi:hypothetical protein
MPCISKIRDRSDLAALALSGKSGAGVGISHGMDLARQDQLWKKTMQFVRFNPVNSPLGQP